MAKGTVGVPVARLLAVLVEALTFAFATGFLRIAIELS